MQNIDVRFNATSNFAKVRGDLAALEAQAASLSSVFNKGAYAKTPALVNPTAWGEATAAVNRASRVYRDAASSSGLFTTQQIRATSEAEKFTKSLQKQKLSLGDMIKHQGIMKEVYRDQLRYQRMTAHYWGTDQMGRAVTDIAIPKNATKELDNMRRRMGFFGNMAASAGTQVVNLGKNIQWSGRQLTVGLTYPMALFGAAAGVMAYKVEGAFASINKVYDVSAKAQTNDAQRSKELAAVRVASMDEAKKAASEYGATIQSTLEVEQALAATGLTMKTGLAQTVDEVQRISRLGDIDAGQTTDMLIALQTAFKLTGKDMTNTLNYMNAASNATSLSLQDIAEATPRAASSMAALGVTAKQMTVLLVSMREAGVNAAEGANALKSATGTILAPSPAAIKFIEQIGGPNLAKNVDNLAKTSKGNLYLAMQQLFELTRGLDKTARQQILVKLFGKYQFNRVSAMLDNLGAAFDGTENQAKKAMDLMGQSAAENATMAANSLKAMTDNASGRFKQAWASLQISLAETGKPFLEVATRFLEGVNKIAQGFNNLSDFQKHTALLAAGALAAAGPLIMMAGLVMNLTGQFIKGVGVIAKFLGISTLVTKEEQAAALTTEAQNKALQTQVAVTNNLAAETNVLTAAMRAATESVVARLEAEGMMTGALGEEAGAAAKTAATVVEAEAEKQAAVERTSAMVQAQNEAMLAASTAAAKRGIFGEMTPLNVPANPVAPIGKTITHPYTGEQRYVRDEAATAKAVAAEEARVAALNMANREQAALTNKTNAQLAIQNKVRNSISGGGIAMGVMGASMAAMMISSNHVVDSIAKWAMIGTIAVPAMKGLLTAVGGVGSGVLGSVKAFRLANVAAVGLTGTMGAATAAAKGFGVALNEALGPIGWIVLGITAVVGTFMIIKNHNDKIREQNEAIVKQQLAANKALQDSTASIATNMGKAAGAYKQIVNIGGAAAGGTSASSNLLKSYNYYKGEDGQKEVAALKGQNGGLLDTDSLMDQVRTKFINLQVLGGDTAKQAQTDIQGMLLAAGMGAKQAADIAEGAYKRLGDISKVNWAKPIEDQITALNNVAGNQQLFRSEMVIDSAGPHVALSDLDPGMVEQLTAQGKQAANIFNEALANTTDPKKAKAIIKQYTDAALSQWNIGFKELTTSDVSGSDELKAIFAKYGVDSGAAFSEAWANNGDFKKELQSASKGWNSALMVGLDAATKSGTTFEKSVMGPLADSSWYLSDGITTAAAALKEFAAAGIGLNPKEAANAIKTQNEEYSRYADLQARMAAMRGHAGAGAQGQDLLNLQNQLNTSGKRLTKQINELNQAYGFKQGRNSTEAMYNLMHSVKRAAGDATNETKKLDKSLHDLPTRMNININVKQAISVVKDSMSAVQNDMADSAMSHFNTGWDTRMASAQSSWDHRSSALEASQQRASSTLEAQQQAQQAGFEARWERRKDAVTKAYQAQIDANTRAIDAEKKADETRQRLFENEKARLAAMAELQNNNIDFNTALNEGRLDDAAKIQNNSAAKSASDQMDAEVKAAEARSQAKIDALEKKNSRLEKERDREVKQLEAMEARQRRGLERMQEARTKALEKSQAQETAALARREKNSMASLQKQRDYEEAMLSQRLELFKSYTARNQKDLERWMKKVGLSYDDFGSDVKAKGEKWSSYFQKSLSAHIRQAGTEVMNDNIWSKVGKEMGNKILAGLGFKGMGDFRNFVRTGEMGGGGKGGKGKPVNDTPETHHTGGVVGSGGGSRGNIPNSYKGLHPSEKMVRAQKGEYIVNTKASQQHRGLLDAINNGSVMDPTPRGVMGGFSEAGGSAFNMGSGNPSIAGLVAGVIGKAFSTGTTNALNAVYDKANAKYSAAMTGGVYSGLAGKYGQRTFNNEQMKNAATIASVGSGMGMSKRDIEIGIMTAITESGLINIHGGDRDSQGLFQQRPSQGWGTVAQVTNPEYAAKKFFSVLKGVGDREGMAPWLAAQAVQRSAYSDGSNYRNYWDEAIGIFTKGLKRGQNGNYAAIGGGYIAGAGGGHRPINASTSGRIHDEYTGYPAVDFPAPVGTPVYAVADGTITRSFDIPGYEPRNSKQNGYRSYGRVEYLKTDAGPEVLYAHLSRRSVNAGTRVRGGSTIGYSGDTGHSTGPHLHFGSKGASPMAWLRKGGEVKWDNTPAVLHQGETVLTKNLTSQFKENVASGGGDTYTVTVDLRGAYIKEDIDIEKAVNIALDNRNAKTGRKRVVR